MATKYVSGVDYEGVRSLLYRLERGDTVYLSTMKPTHKDPSRFTVTRNGMEPVGADDTLYYRVHVEGSQGGQYVVHPEDKPSNKGTRDDTPEMFHLSPSKTDPHGRPAEESVGTVIYATLEYGTPGSALK